MSTELWHPDFNITDDLVKIILEKQFPDLSPLKIKCIGEGWDNKVFLINDRFVFRFPHRACAASLIERENAVLQHLQNRLNLKIPNPIYTGIPSEDYPYHFHGYAMISGKPGSQANLSETTRKNSITKLAKFLKQLHSITETKARAIGAKDQVFDRTHITGTVNALTERVEKINARKIATVNPAIFNKEIEIATAVKLPQTKVLVHGDLYSRHLMFDDNQLIGVIDWGDVGLNNPAVDLGVVFNFYPRDYHQAFFDIYGDIDSQTYACARFIGLYIAMTVMLYGHDIGDAQLTQEAKASILRINSQLLE